MRNINEGNFTAWDGAYAGGLLAAMESHPEDYGVPFNGASAYYVSTCRNMIAAFRDGKYNHAGRGVANACKALGLKHTRTAIEAFLTKGAI